MYYLLHFVCSKHHFFTLVTGKVRIGVSVFVCYLRKQNYFLISWSDIQTS